jgi:hypothetical protein
MAWSNADPVVQPTSYPRKIMMAIFFGVNSIAFIDILPENAKLSSECFKENIIKEFDMNVGAAGRKSHPTCIYLHFDNIPVRNTRTVAQTITKCEFRRLDHSHYSPDLAPCDFFLFSYLQEKMSGSCTRRWRSQKRRLRWLSRLFRSLDWLQFFKNDKGELTNVWKIKKTTSGKLSFYVFSSRISLLEIESPETERTHCTCLTIACSLPMLAMIIGIIKSIDSTFYAMHMFLICFILLVLYSLDCPMAHDFALDHNAKLSDFVGFFLLYEYQITNSGQFLTVLLWHWEKKTRKHSRIGDIDVNENMR